MVTEFLIKWWELIVIFLLVADIVIQKTKWKGDDDILAMIKNIIKAIFTSKPGKLLLLIGLSALLLPSLAFADPYLVCNPQTNVTHYVIIIDGSTSEVLAYDLGDGTVMLKYDLAGVSTGAHNVEVEAKNVWGVSSPVPFAFTKAVAGVPANIRIE
jgi:hypothetical protein